MLQSLQQLCWLSLGLLQHLSVLFEVRGWAWSPGCPAHAVMALRMICPMAFCGTELRLTVLWIIFPKFLVDGVAFANFQITGISLIFLLLNAWKGFGFFASSLITLRWIPSGPVDLWVSRHTRHFLLDYGAFTHLPVTNLQLNILRVTGFGLKDWDKEGLFLICWHCAPSAVYILHWHVSPAAGCRAL